jgi:DNA repair protein RecN (Recombination protein N)
MLQHLSISNYALIAELDMDWPEGFTVITGETGAGKSILLGALSLILGQRVDVTILLAKDRKCVVEGTFLIRDYDLEHFFQINDLDYDESVVLRREINPNGKSRAFINDTPVSLNVMKQLGEKLVDIHSQYQTYILNDADFQLTVLDSYGHLLDRVEAYRKGFHDYLEQKRLHQSLLEREKQSNADQDYFRFQYEELEQAHLTEGEQEELERELELLTHAEDIKTGLLQAGVVLQGSEDNLISRLAAVKAITTRAAQHLRAISDINERIESGMIELKDIASELDRIEQQIVIDPDRIQRLNQRLDMISHLEHKHRVGSIKELILLKETFHKKLGEISSLNDKIIQLEEQIARNGTKLWSQAQAISESRHKVIPAMEKELLGLIRSLGMPDAQFRIMITSTDDLSNDGINRVMFMFSANKGIELRDIVTVASGGERSRLMLAVKSMIARKNLLPTIIFDEIDMGVSGEVAGKVGMILQQMAKSMQVIVITHLPQIAGKSRSHYLVYKYTVENKAFSAVKILSDEERVMEIAKLLSDQTVTISAIATARELLDGMH